MFGDGSLPTRELGGSWPRGGYHGMPVGIPSDMSTVGHRVSKRWPTKSVDEDYLRISIVKFDFGGMRQLFFREVGAHAPYPPGNSVRGSLGTTFCVTIVDILSHVVPARVAVTLTPAQKCVWASSRAAPGAKW